MGPVSQADGSDLPQTRQTQTSHPFRDLVLARMPRQWSISAATEAAFARRPELRSGSL